MGIDDHFWMNKAYEQALLAERLGEVPVGAVLVDAEQKLIGSGYNQVIAGSDPTLHAEMVAISNAAKAKNNYRLDGCTLYVTLEPCPMCACAMVHARLARVVFACRDFKTGAAGSVLNLLKGHPFNHQVIIDEGVLEQACSQLLSQFFAKKRSIFC